MKNTPRITVHNRQRKLRFDLPALTRSAEQGGEAVARIRRSRRTPFDELNEVHVMLISDRMMAYLHRQFLHQIGPTDVITFDHGEIFISVETARRNARRFNTSVVREIELYVVHGLLHLRGFDDTTPAATREMERWQAKIWRSLPR